MPFVAWVTVIIAMLIVFFAAVGLFRVAVHLRAVDKTLEALVNADDSQQTVHILRIMAVAHMQQVACN